MIDKTRLLAPLIFGMGLGTAFAENDSIEISRPAFTIFHEMGNIEKATEFTTPIHDYWIQRGGVFVNIVAKKNERLAMDVLFGGVLWNPTYNSNGSSDNVLRYFNAMAPRIDLSYSFGDLQKPYLKASLGILQYKYNEYSRNLGEYAFRTTAYPSLVYSGGLTYVDNNRASVTGLKLTHALGNSFTHDLLLSMETDLLPHYDLSLTYVAKLNLKGIFKVSAGAEFARILPLESKITNPDVAENHFYTLGGATYVDNRDYYSQRLADTAYALIPADSVLFTQGDAFADSLFFYQAGNPTGGIPAKTFAQALDSLRIVLGIAAPASIGNFEASSITPFVSFSFDPKPLFGAAIFGPKDFVIYGEAALLGIKDYPVFYEKKAERTIAMVGFNIPTFKMLDVFSVEFERFASKFPNSADFYQAKAGKPDGITITPMPIPTFNSESFPYGFSPEAWKKDDLKWSVFAQRKIISGLSLSTQIASDNSRGWIFPSGRRYWNLYRKPSDWYWMFKLTANI